MLKHLLVTLAATTVVITTPNELIFQSSFNDVVNKVDHINNRSGQSNDIVYSVLQLETIVLTLETGLEDINSDIEQPLKFSEDDAVVDTEQSKQKEENATPIVVIAQPPVNNTTPLQVVRQENSAVTQSTPQPTTPTPQPTAPETNTATTQTSNQQETTVVASTPAETFELEVLRLTNIERVNVGLRPLRYNTSLEEGARIRSQEIIEYFSHTRPDGSRFFTVFGPDFRFRNVGENLASGFRTPAQVVTAWMNSTSHRANILNPNFEELAVASTRGDDGRMRWVQIFYRAP